MRLVAALSLIFITAAQAAFEYRKDWKVHKICGEDARLKTPYCLELIELENKNPQARPALLIPGLFQNAYIWDLIPEDGISAARYLREKWNVRPFILHVRGIGNSDYPLKSKSNMDDIAMSDIELGVDSLYEMFNEKIFLIGHSQGSITSQMYLAGIDRCLVATCFNPVSALKRQRKVKAAGLLSGNTAMSVDNPDNKLDEIAISALKLKPALKFLDEIDVKTLVRLTGPVGYLNIWEWLYNRHNTEAKARKALYTKSADTTTLGILIQFAQGIRDRAIKTSSKIPYPSMLSWIRLPVFQQVYEDDSLNEPAGTIRDNFLRIGSKNKEYEIVPDRGHEDFYMNKDLHSDLDSVMRFLVNQ